MAGVDKLHYRDAISKIQTEKLHRINYLASSTNTLEGEKREWKETMH